MVLNIEEQLAETFRTALKNKVEKHIERSYYNYQVQALSLGRYINIELYRIISDEYLNYKCAGGRDDNNNNDCFNYWSNNLQEKKKENENKKNNN